MYAGCCADCLWCWNLDNNWNNTVGFSNSGEEWGIGRNWRLGQTNEGKMSGSPCKHPQRRGCRFRVLNQPKHNSRESLPLPCPPSSSHRNTSSQATRVPILTELSQTGRPPPIPDTQEAFGARSTVSDVNRFTTMTCDPGEEQRTEGTSPVNDPLIIIDKIRSRWRHHHRHNSINTDWKMPLKTAGQRQQFEGAL